MKNPKVTVVRSEEDLIEQELKLDCCERKIEQIALVCEKHGIARAIFKGCGNLLVEDTISQVVAVIRWVDEGIPPCDQLSLAGHFLNDIEDLLGFDVHVAHLIDETI